MVPPVAEPDPAPAADPAPAVPVDANDATVLAPILTVPAADPAPVAPAAPDTSARRAELETEIARQQQIIDQLSAVQAALGVATPAAVAQSLADAQAAQVAAKSELDALPPPAPAIDPAVIAALEAEVASQQQIVTQLAGVQAALGVATPAAVVQSLADAQAALQKAQDALAGLGVTPAAAPLSPDAPTMIAPPAMPVVAPAAPVALPPTPPAGPRLVLEEQGKELFLPPGKSEVTIGREDPISGIYPELDLTPYGGESNGVSRQHARLSNAGGQWSLTDLNSTNHTKINGVRLEPNVPTPVSDGMQLQFGRLILTFRS